jgi:hypothetical protein
MNTTTKQRFYIQLGSYLSLPYGIDDKASETIYTAIAKSDNQGFIDSFKIVSCKALTKDGLTIYPYKSYKGYDALFTTATKAYVKGVKEKTIDKDLIDTPRRYLFSGPYKQDLLKLRKGNVTTLIDNATPYQAIIVTDGD